MAFQIYDFNLKMPFVLKLNRNCRRYYFASSQWRALSHLIILQCLINHRTDVYVLAVTRRCALVCVRALRAVMTAHCARGRHFAKLAE